MSKRIDFPKELMDHTYATIRSAFNNTKTLMEEHGELGNINITSILTHIIQTVGRYADSYASDALYSIDDIRTLCEHEYPAYRDIDEIFVFGIRRHGVDGNNFLMTRLVSTIHGPINGYVYPETMYRSILAVRVHIWCERAEDSRQTSRYVDATCELKDLTDSFRTINSADIAGDGTLIHPPYLCGNPEPVGS